MLRFTQHNRCATEDAEAIASSVLKNVDEIFGKLHKPGMKAISLEKIDLVEGNMVQVNKTKLPVGNSYRQDFMEFINHYLAE